VKFHQRDIIGGGFEMHDRNLTASHIVDNFVNYLRDRSENYILR
jgi:hypothetical protein